MSDEGFILTRDRGFFTVLAVHRDDVAQALCLHGPEELRNDDGDVGDDAMSLANQLDDASMDYLARKLGDAMMNGGDYYESIAYIAEPMIEFPS